jgi:The  BURPS668_1122 family of deaminases
MKKVFFLSLMGLMIMMSSFMIMADDPTTVAGAKNIFSTFRSNLTGKKPGNLGYLHGNMSGTVEGKQVKETLSSTAIMGSGLCETDDILGKSIFDYAIVSRANELRTEESVDAWYRCSDSEYKLLKNFVKKIGAVKGKTYDVTGKLVVASEWKYCKSCRSVINQFKIMFPGLTFIEIEGVRGTNADTPVQE